MTTDAILERLQGVRKNGPGWSARCPGHDDRRASLSISIGDDGRTLMHCHAGCPPEAVVAAIGLRMSDLMPSGNSQTTPDRNGHAKKKSGAVYSFDGIIKKLSAMVGGRRVRTDRYDGFAVLRFDLPTPPGQKQEKTFRPICEVKLGDGRTAWRLGYPEGQRPIFRRREVVEELDTSMIVVCAGEKATEAAVNLGLVATTCAGGEQAVKRTDWSPVARFDQVAVSIDNDPTGESFGHQVAVELHAVKPDLPVKIVRLPDLPPKGDIVEWVAAGGTRGQFLGLVESTPAVTAEELAEWKAEHKASDSPEKQKPFEVKLLADMICRDNHFAQDAGGKLYRFHAGAYRRQAEEYVRGRVKSLCVGGVAKWSSHLASEVVEFIRVDAPQLWERPLIEVLNVQNGLLRVSDRVLLPHDPAHLSPVQLPVTYDPAARCPDIDAFVNQVFPPDAVSLAWELPAWLMLPDTSIQKAVLLTGEGANGKSTWLNLVATFLGKANVSGVSLHKLEADKFAAARLIGKLANICPDLPSEHLVGTSVFKAIAGGDTLVAEYKFKDSFDFTPYARLVFSANHPPKSKDGSHAFFRRWLVVPFDRTFAPREQIPRDILDATLTAPSELSGLLNLALDALDRLRVDRRFSEPESVQGAWEDFRAETDPLAVWLDQATLESPDAFVTKAALIAAYNSHATRNDLLTIGKKKFGQALRRLRPNVDDGQRMVGGSYDWCYIGIGLVQPQT